MNVGIHVNSLIWCHCNQKRDICTVFFYQSWLVMSNLQAISCPCNFVYFPSVMYISEGSGLLGCDTVLLMCSYWHLKGTQCHQYSYCSSMYTYCFLCILIVVYVYLLMSIYSYRCLCILIDVYVFLLLSMYSYCCLCILLVRPCILTVVYVYILFSTYS